MEAASARAAGFLHVLDVSGWRDLDNAALMAVAHANAASLLELRAWGSSLTATYRIRFPIDTITALLEAAPQLHALQCDVDCSVAEASAAIAIKRAAFWAAAPEVCLAPQPAI